MVSFLTILNIFLILFVDTKSAECSSHFQDILSQNLLVPVNQTPDPQEEPNTAVPP